MWVQNKVDESKHEIHSQVDAITAGTASVVNLTAGKFTRGTRAAGLSFLFLSFSLFVSFVQMLLKSGTNGEIMFLNGPG